MIKAVIFDMDGVIVDSEPIHLQAENQVLKNFGKSLNEAEKAEYLGLKTEDFYSKLKKRWDIPLSLDDLCRKHNEIDLQLLRKLAKPMAGAKKAVKVLSKIYKIGLASSSEKIKIQEIIEKFNLKAYFQVTVSAEEVENGKPFPEIYLEAAKRLGVKASECIAVEDSATGIKSAKAAGMLCVAVPNRHTKIQDFAMADKVISSLSELTEADLQQLSKNNKNSQQAA